MNSKVVTFKSARFMHLIQVDECMDVEPYIFIHRDDTGGSAQYFINAGVKSWSALEDVTRQLQQLEADIRTGAEVIRDKEDRFIEL